MHIGCGGGQTVPLNCTNGTTPTRPHQRIAQVTPKRRRSCDNPHFTGVHTATSPKGPWTVALGGQPVTVQQPPHAPPPWHDGTAITNPSLWPLANDSGVLLAYSAGCPLCNISKGHKHIGLAFGANWSGPFVDLTPAAPIFPFASEDPCIFVSPDTGTYHILAHTDATGSAERPAVWPHVSAHAFADDPRGNWTVSAIPPYTRQITWEDGTVTEVETRERPQVIFIGGVPSLLTNGVKPGNATSPATPAGYTGDWSYTHVQRIG